ncbi:MFS transporter [Aeromicrobium sp. CTD01-1L150]|uniref:MFS transporter n=1 Tax=Aeromicrobium sp. CTD01-1L150 TaxID=3341830 RepID=UPI0035C23280
MADHQRTSPVSQGTNRTGAGVVLAGLCLTEIVSWGVLYYAFPVLAPRISAETGWSSMSVAAAFSAALVVSALLGVPVGRFIDRHGPRLPMTVGSVVAVAAMAVVATAPNLGMFAFGWVLAGAAMAGVLYPPAFAAITRWFTDRRLQALAMLTLVAGLASTVFAPLVAVGGGTLGWRGTYLAAAVVLAVVTIPVHWFLLRRPWPREEHGEHDAEPVTASAYASQITSSAQFLLLTIGLALVSLAMYAALIAIVPLMLERGLSTQLAAWVLGLGGLGQVAGRLIYTAVAPRVSLGVRTATVFVLVTASIAALAVVPGPASLLVALSVAAGVGRGIATLLQATAVTDRWGPRAYGRLSGVMGLPVLVAAALAPWVGASLATVTGSYAMAFAVLALLSAAGTVLMILSTRSRTA